MASSEHARRDVDEGWLPSLSRVRRVAFYGVIMVALALYAVMMSEFLVFPIIGWFEEAGIHHFHDLVLFGMIWLGIIGIVVQLYNPSERVNAVLASVLVMLPIAVLALATGSPITMMPVIFGTLGLVILGLHPAGRGVLEVDITITEGDRWLAGLLFLATIPLGWFAIQELSLQFTAGDSHAELVHYGAMAVAAVFILGMGTLAIVRTRDRRFAAWAVGVLAAYLGLAASAFPELTSSPGFVWGGLAIVWGIGFIAVFEWQLAR